MVLDKFRKRAGITAMNLHGEGAEVDKNVPNLLAALENLYNLIGEYEPILSTTWTKQDFFTELCQDIVTETQIPVS